MTLWDKLTGSDITKYMEELAGRAGLLPPEHRQAWQEIQKTLWESSDVTGRNIPSILDSVLSLLEETAAEGISVKDALGDDLKGFCRALMGQEGAKSYRDKWREQCNKNIARKLNRRLS